MTSQPLMRYFMELGRKVGEGCKANAFRKRGIRWSRNTYNIERNNTAVTNHIYHCKLASFQVLPTVQLVINY